MFPTKDEALAFINDFGGGSVGTKTQTYTPTKKGFGKQEPGFGKQEPGFGKQEPGFGKQGPGFVSRDNSLKREVLSLKACVQGMRKKFDDFVEQQKIAFEDIESRTDMIILAIEGTPSGLDSSVSILNIQMMYLLSHFGQSHLIFNPEFSTGNLGNSRKLTMRCDQNISIGAVKNLKLF